MFVFNFEKSVMCLRSLVSLFVVFFIFVVCFCCCELKFLFVNCVVVWVSDLRGFCNWLLIIISSFDWVVLDFFNWWWIFFIWCFLFMSLKYIVLKWLDKFCSFWMELFGRFDIFWVWLKWRVVWMRWCMGLVIVCFWCWVCWNVMSIIFSVEVSVMSRIIIVMMVSVLRDLFV